MAPRKKTEETAAQIAASIPETRTVEQAAIEEAALATHGEGDSPTNDDRVGTVEHIEDMPEMSPEG
ncbi:MAG: hypothetical protein ABI743_11805, partial [bacterium]